MCVCVLLVKSNCLPPAGTFRQSKRQYSLLLGLNGPEITGGAQSLLPHAARGLRAVAPVDPRGQACPKWLPACHWGARSQGLCLQVGHPHRASASAKAQPVFIAFAWDTTCWCALRSLSRAVDFVSCATSKMRPVCIKICLAFTPRIPKAFWKAPRPPEGPAAFEKVLGPFRRPHNSLEGPPGLGYLQKRR